ncbi:tRNA pseudouridine(38-40) synthase TruA [Chlamydia psittaci]|uniref:tRNA pseudouridine(38-40) synthase TruA n=1 Tax=Chlamydia psittaci TaxID=83554 RepID=UPI00027E58D7|nr:tRNA pseudouridine(38-40) synthase TruA [Chlamydia psittaci]AFS27707.1 tRNA pseudouridine synthase A [Chlamydia psittaci NJ1]KPZ36566.1 tRNA pseudouridine synthase A [Chlamydia psittaci NJ1]MDS0919754.1 tRNA pseudouridine(38-40) synthase TruA [Chlamydia psittaci]MDS0989785.1 tRNA pseudouridine(38-40) synthase TruA [Chlamydia psittaci]MDS0995760.1 tRNA pseudouridine(38-40) synthase TruA [Chlamydia psittaci]
MTQVVLLLAYQGTAYAGWQRQPNDLSVQEVIENSLTKVVGKRIHVTSSGRTDAGVHAFGQVAHFPQPDHPRFSQASGIKKMLNALLPKDIVIRDVVLGDDIFHSRFSAIAKEYRYLLTRSPKPLPWERYFSYYPRHHLRTDLMQEGAKYLIGTHDFASFANHGRDYTSTIRTLFNLDIVDNGETVTIICKGNGFLYKMVRNIVGSLLDISRGKYPPEYIQEILIQKNRRKGPPAAPSYALSLYHVCYPKPYHWFCTPECNINSLKEEK